MPPNFDIHFVIFDCDGTLVDSETVSMHIFREHIAPLGYEIGQQDALDRYAGQNLNEVLAEICETLGVSVPDQFMDRFRSAQIEQLKRELVAIDGVREVLSNLSVPYCVASNAPRYKIETCLDTTSLDHFFASEMVFSAYDIERWKPAPDLFELAARLVGVAPRNCAVVEDSLFGIEAGLAAGMNVIAFDPHARLPTKLDGVTSISSMRELLKLLPTNDLSRK